MESKHPYVNTPESQLLLAILNQHPPFQFENIATDKFIELVKLHNLTPFVFYRLKDYSSLIPPDIYSYLRSGYLANVSRNLGFWDEFLKINDAFKQNNISILPLKGMDMLARFCPAFDLRTMSDIDILIKEDQFVKAEKVLSDLGYQKRLYGLKEKYWRERQCHVAFHRNHTMVEAHWGLDFKRANRIILQQLWKRVKQVQLGNDKLNIFSPEDALFSLALHLRRFGNILSLKQVLDAAKIIKESSEFDWDYVLEESKRGAMKATTYFILMQISLFTKVNISIEIFKKLGISRWHKILIKNFLLKHTFKVPPSLKEDYLKAHFLLYDNPCEPFLYLINIPYEQFCKFYDLKPYANKTDFLYRIRLLYIPISFCLKKR